MADTFFKLEELEKLKENWIINNLFYYSDFLYTYEINNKKVIVLYNNINWDIMYNNVELNSDMSFITIVDWNYDNYIKFVDFQYRWNDDRYYYLRVFNNLKYSYIYISDEYIHNFIRSNLNHISVVAFKSDTNNVIYEYDNKFIIYQTDNFELVNLLELDENKDIEYISLFPRFWFTDSIPCWDKNGIKYELQLNPYKKIKSTFQPTDY